MDAAVITFSALGVMVAVVGLYFPFRSHRDRRLMDDAVGGWRRRRRGQRNPLTQPLTVPDRLAGLALVESMRCNRGVPMAFLAPRSRIKGLWVWFRRTYTMSETSPKQLFSVDSWEYSPMGGMSFDGQFRHGSGFALAFRLDRGESSQHLRHSANSGKSPLEKLFVLAADEDLADRNARVRCLVVDTKTMRISEADPHHIVVQSAEKMRHGGPRVYLEEQWRVPSDAFWLTYPKGKGSEPEEGWGSRSESFMVSGTPSGPCAIEDLGYARRANKAHRIRIALASIVAAAGGYFYWWYAERASAEDPISQQVWATFRGVWLLVWVVIAITVALAAMGHWCRSSLWFRKKNGVREEWQGGTLTAVRLGEQISSRGTVAGNEWGLYAETSANRFDDLGHGPSATLRHLAEKYLLALRWELEEAISLERDDEDFCRDLWGLLESADTHIPGPGLHTSGWRLQEILDSPELSQYRDILVPLRSSRELWQGHTNPRGRRNVMAAAEDHLKVCIDHLASRREGGKRPRTLKASLRNSKVKRTLTPQLLLDIRTFAAHNCRGFDFTETLYVYYLARLFGFKVLEAAGQAQEFAKVLEDAERVELVRAAENQDS